MSGNWLSLLAACERVFPNLVKMWSRTPENAPTDKLITNKKKTARLENKTDLGKILSSGIAKKDRGQCRTAGRGMDPKSLALKGFTIRDTAIQTQKRERRMRLLTHFH